MRAFPVLALVAAAMSGSVAAAPADEKPATVVVEMSGRAFRPQVIRLDSHHPTTLRLINRDDTTHDFTAPAFFGTAKLNSRDSAALNGDRIDIPGHEQRTITLIPAVGHYDLKSTKALDVVSNMQGQILVY